VTRLADEARTAVQTDADDARIASLQSDLEAALRELMQAAPQAAPEARPRPVPGTRT
jgi:hypothetical protein